MPELRKVIKIVTQVNTDGVLSTTNHNSSGGRSELSNYEDLNKFDNAVSAEGP